MAVLLLPGIFWIAILRNIDLPDRLVTFMLWHLWISGFIVALAFVSIVCLSVFKSFSCS
jgi:hypothetical protein